jgi:hypothetical protein
MVFPLNIGTVFGSAHRCVPLPEESMPESSVLSLEHAYDQDTYATFQRYNACAHPASGREQSVCAAPCAKAYSCLYVSTPLLPWPSTVAFQAPRILQQTAFSTRTSHHVGIIQVALDKLRFGLAAMPDIRIALGCTNGYIIRRYDVSKFAMDLSNV